jgi:hypothetical protein
VEKHTRLIRRIALSLAFVCPVACSPTAQQKLSPPLAEQAAKTPAETAHQHAYHEHHHHHPVAHTQHEALTGAPAQYPERQASARQDEALRHFGLADPSASKPSDGPANIATEEPTPPPRHSDAKVEPSKIPVIVDRPATGEKADQPHHAATDTAPAPDDALPDEEYAHADDYSWVQGHLEYRHRTREWHIRFAPPWLEDRYGGSLVLQGGEDQASWKDGAWVRMVGTVKEDDSPIYQVDRVDLLQPSFDSED